MKLNRNLKKVLDRKIEIDQTVVQSVSAILDDIKKNGDAAVAKYCQKFGEGNSLVSQKQIKAATARVGADFIRILERAAQNIREFHLNQKTASWQMLKEGRVILGQIVTPIERVALYVPGGTATYPSSVLMNAIPAQIAGVKELVIFTPKLNDLILAAAAVCGIETIYTIGGAQAVAVVAFGTQTIAKFDRIVGPGNAYVAEAKRQVFGTIGIDMIAGPSEILIIADEYANPKYIAADLMSQAEHDEMASAILITTSERIIDETEAELERQLATLERSEIIRKSLEGFGAAILVSSLEEAFEISNKVAPEHLEILTQNPLEKLPLVKNAGSIFLGENTPEPLGDYMGGTNHVLPTNGTARFSSALGVYDFVKYTSFSYYTKQALLDSGEDVMEFAKLEGLDAHANSIKRRFE